MFTIRPEDDAILDFRRPYTFLSNFSRAQVTVDGVTCSTLEHAYQMQKTLDPAWREAIRLKASPLWARQSTRTKAFPMRPDWASIKVGVMRDLLVQKFTCHPKLAEKLLATGDRLIAESNHWGDGVWGVVQGEGGVWRGENLLGVLLMEVRDGLRSGELRTHQDGRP